MVLLCFAIVNVAFLIVGTYALITNRLDWLINMLIVSLALNGVVSFVETVWNPLKIVSIQCLIYLFINNWARGLNRGVREQILVAMCALVISLVSAFIWETKYEANVLTLQGSLLRPFAQTAQYICTVGVLVAVMRYAKTPESVSKVLLAFFYTSLAAALVGWIHYVFIRLGLQFLPIPRYTGNVSDMAAFAYGGSVVQRVYALSGEPKDLATLLIPALVVQFFYALVPGSTHISQRTAICAMGLTAPILYLTYSTGAYLILAVIVLVLGWIFMHGRLAVAQRMLNVALLALLVSALVALSNTDIISKIYTYVRVRTVDRLSGAAEEHLEPQMISYMLFEKPETLMFGLGPGMYNYHGFGDTLGGTNIAPIKSAWVSMLGDVGVVGILAFAALIVPAFRAGQRQLRSSTPTFTMAAAFGGLLGSLAVGIATDSRILVAVFAALLLRGESAPSSRTRIMSDSF